jgi:hypothetical protein
METMSSAYLVDPSRVEEVDAELEGLADGAQRFLLGGGAIKLAVEGGHSHATSECSSKSAISAQISPKLLRNTLGPTLTILEQMQQVPDFPEVFVEQSTFVELMNSEDDTLLICEYGVFPRRKALFSGGRPR